MKTGPIIGVFPRNPEKWLYLQFQILLHFIASFICINAVPYVILLMVYTNKAQTHWIASLMFKIVWSSCGTWKVNAVCGFSTTNRLKVLKRCEGISTSCFLLTCGTLMVCPLGEGNHEVKVIQGDVEAMFLLHHDVLLTIMKRKPYLILYTSFWIFPYYG